MARSGRLTALAALTLTAAPLQRAVAVEAGAPVAVAARLSQDQGGAKLVFDLSRSVDVSARAMRARGQTYPAGVWGLPIPDA